MSGDKCRWFNKNGFAIGTGECVLHRRVCGSGHKVCEQYEEYESRPHGKWLISYECPNCGEIRNTPFEVCPQCKVDMREGDEK